MRSSSSGESHDNGHDEDASDLDDSSEGDNSNDDSSDDESDHDERMISDDERGPNEAQQASNLKNLPKEEFELLQEAIVRLLREVYVLYIETYGSEDQCKETKPDGKSKGKSDTKSKAKRRNASPNAPSESDAIPNESSNATLDAASRAKPTAKRRRASISLTKSTKSKRVVAQPAQPVQAKPKTKKGSSPSHANKGNTSTSAAYWALLQRAIQSGQTTCSENRLISHLRYDLSSWSDTSTGSAFKSCKPLTSRPNPIHLLILGATWIASYAAQTQASVCPSRSMTSVSSPFAELQD